MKLDHPYDVCFKHSAISFGVPDMPPPDVGSSMGPISLHKAIGVPVNKPENTPFAGCAGCSFGNMMASLRPLAEGGTHHVDRREEQGNLQALYRGGRQPGQPRVGG